MSLFTMKPSTFKYEKNIRSAVGSFRKAVGTVNTKTPVAWPAFLEEAKSEVNTLRRKSPAYSVVPKQNRLIGDYLHQMTIGWVVVILVEFIQRCVLKHYKKTSPIRFKFVTTFVADVRLTDLRQIAFDTQNLTKIKYDPLGSFVFLLVFVDPNGNEAVCILFIEKNTIEVFVPFPHAWKVYKAMSLVTCEVVKLLATQWMGADLHGEKECDRMSIVKMYKTSSNFPDSNVWVIYFLMMRMQLSREAVQSVLVDTANMVELNTKAVYSFQHVGGLLSQCMLLVANQGGEMGKNASEAYIGYFSATAKYPVFLQGEETITLLNSAFARCDMSNQDLYVMFDIKAQGRESSWPTELYESKEWSRFAEIPGAAEPQYVFVPEKYPKSKTESKSEKKEVDKKSTEKDKKDKPSKKPKKPKKAKKSNADDIFS
jgi:hypothetical protein